MMAKFVTRGVSFSARIIVACLALVLVVGTVASAEDTTPTPKKDEMINVLMQTSLGDIVLELNHTKAPITVDNFLSYTDKGFYDGTVFHRVIGTFMIQGGGFTPDMKQKPTDTPIKNEWENGLKNVRGSIAMARLGGQANSATCQFFINVQDNAGLDQPNDGAGYAVFGKVIKGMDVVDKIRKVETGVSGGHRDVPKVAVVIEKVTRLTDEKVDAKGEKPKEKPADDK